MHIAFLLQGRYPPHTPPHLTKDGDAIRERKLVLNPQIAVIIAPELQAKLNCATYVRAHSGYSGRTCIQDEIMTRPRRREYPECAPIQDIQDPS